MTDIPLVGFVLIPVIAGLLLYLKPSRITLASTLAVQALILFFNIKYMLLLQSSGEILECLSGYPLPLGMALKLDMLSSIMLLMNNLLFPLMVVFNMKKEYMNKLFIFLFLSLQGLINGIFLTTDFFNFYILMDAATVIVSILIMYKKDSRSMYDGMIYLMVNMAGMAFFLLGIGYIYRYFGALDFITVSRLIKEVDNPGPLVMPYAMMLTGISLKAALMPLFSWLPKAHGTPSAPSIISSILSGIFIKLGVYMFIRLSIMFGPIVDVSDYFLFMGYITSIAGFIFAISQSDIKLILAYHTISQVGLIVIGLSMNNLKAYDGALYHMLAHGIFKSLLFLIAGILVEMFHTRKISEIRGLWHHSKILSISLIAAVLSITGAPFFSGGYSKHLIMYSANGIFAPFILKIISAGTMISFIKFFKVIFSRPSATPVRKPGVNETAVISVMALLCLFLGVFGDNFILLATGHASSYSIFSQIGHLPTYVLTFAISYLVYVAIIKDRLWITRVRGFELGFNSISLSIISFFAMSLMVLSLSI
ncbi:multisubunit sodium/proton antiporter, MrpD subunit [Dethiosulfatibacter aminovorans DSM 17477]|uniref:Multisubunit sodium/proton antiporter, MrpD subunit n=1 Tax=Dethiosulfatibacter aminovorans DSM 17477 TaxID=1121476 RepID=A0A1M6GSB1_9FIRM|nr:proton-conducting transporter membrane subunit [Dethiosulfatibacter aminovorans]SHJ12822.1 multisubunit sodium/proton antiporter, MrpD subunit [Dethiosulfatibacter aminovorans DSM 17477]